MQCHPEIALISNELFYGSQLQTADSLDTRQPEGWEMRPLNWVAVDGQEESSSGSWRNKQEAAVCQRIVQVLLSKDVPVTEIGVICLYKGQVDLVQYQFSRTSIPKRVLVSTVDALQGAERDVIILSVVRQQSSVFMEDARRINVALTRARRMLVILGSMQRGEGIWSRIASDFCTPVEQDAFLEELSTRG